MSERMAQVELPPLAALPLVALHDVGLHADSRRDDLLQQRAVPPQLLDRTALQPPEERGIGDDARLERLGQPRAELPEGERGEQGRVADHEFGLAKGSDHVLVAVDIDAVLAAHRGVDLPQQRRGDEAEAEPAHVGRGDETRHVGHDAAPDAQHEGRAVHPQLDEAAVERLGGLQGLYGLARTDQQVFVAGQQTVVPAVDIGVGYHHDPPPGRQQPGQ